MLGIALAYVGLTGFDRWIGDLPRADGIVLDTRVLLFTIALSAATALVFGLAPAVRSIGPDVATQLRESGRAATDSRRLRWVRGGLIAGEVGVSLVLVALAGLLLRSFLAVTSRDPGIDPDAVWIVALNTPDAQGDAAADAFRQRMGRVLAAIEDVPGVSSVTYGIEMPFENVGGATCCWSLRSAPMDVVDPRADARSVITYLHPVTHRFFETLGTGLLAGSSWTPAEAFVTPRPVVLTESLAIRHFGSAGAAIGQALQVWQLDDRNGPVRVVGVAETTLHYGLDQAHPDALYLPIEALTFGSDAASFAVKAPSLPAGDVVEAIREAIWSVEPSLPVPSVVTLQSMIDDSSAVRRLSSALSSAFGVVALILAAGGLYGTLLYAASQRRRELGIRIALGAGRRQIQSDVVAGGIRLAALGLLFGIPAAIYLGGLLDDFLWNVSPTDVRTLITAAVALLAAAALASWLPAYRASRTDPLEVLRSD
jgi:predicted permease